MSDGAEKPFEATPHRIAKAKREGDLPRSAELGGMAAFAAGACTVAATAPLAGAYARAAIVTAAGGRIPLAASAAVFALAAACVPASALAALACGALQSGGLPMSRLTAKLERLNPFEGCKRMLSRETAGRALRSSAAFVLAAAVMTPALTGGAEGMLHANVAQAAAAAWSACERVGAAAFTVGLLFALAEYAAARRDWLRKLRMSYEDRKREAKEQDGDPFARGRRRTLHRALLRGSLDDVRDAAFVVANPTHVAIALVYRPPDIPVPRVAVRAAGEVALRVRSLARRYGVPVIENVALARALFSDARVGQAIGHAHYVAVAEIVASLSRSSA